MTDPKIFRREYLAEWRVNDGYKKAYELWIEYYYECERFDESVCSGGIDRDGFVMPRDGFECRSINKFAYYKRRDIVERARQYGISDKEWESSKRDAARLNKDGVIREYRRLSVTK